MVFDTLLIDIEANQVRSSLNNKWGPQHQFRRPCWRSGGRRTSRVRAFWPKQTRVGVPAGAINNTIGIMEHAVDAHGTDNDHA
jgi:hypothetical protein